VTHSDFAIRAPTQTGMDVTAEPRATTGRRVGTGERVDESRRILFVSYHFPPSAAVGGRRIAHFATHVRRIGWESHVLTIPESRIVERDAARLRETEGVPVRTAAVLPTAIGLLTALARLRHRAVGGGSGQPGASAAVRSGADGGESVGRRLRRYLLSFALLPDGQKGWCLPAIVESVRLIRRHRCGWFMTSCPPYSVHVVGLVVRSLTRARWVADFRDPWMTTGWKRLYPTCRASIRIESWIERLVVEKADLVVFNVSRLRDAYRARYAHLDGGKFVYVPNGFVPIPRRESAPTRFDRFTITYTGSLYVGRSPEPLLRALSILLDAADIGRDDVSLKLVGHCRFIDGVPTEQVIAKYGLQSVVEVIDPVPHAQAVDLVRRSHLALLLAPDLPFQIPAKVYDYFAAGTRILAIAEDGGTADLLRETGAGEAFAADDIDGIVEALRAAFRSRVRLAAADASVEQFEVQRVTDQLVAHLEEAASSHPAVRRA